MRHQMSIFHALLKPIPWAAFDRLVDRHRADARVRRLSTRTQLIALLYAQFAGAMSLREIETALVSHQARLSPLAACPVSRATLADADAKRPWAVFAGLLECLLAQAHAGLRRASREAVRLIDATGLRLSGLCAEWARVSAAACGAKLHVIYDPDADRPVYCLVTAAKVNDITPAKAMPIEPGATYVFDLGYHDFGFWARLDAAGCRFVTRLKRYTPLQVVAERRVPEGGRILCDRIGHLPARQARSRKNPLHGLVREIRVRLANGKVLRLLSNDLAAPAEALAALYKRRWQIELFFRWVKQVLRIRHFFGRSENAVRIQVAVALSAFVLLRLAQAAHRVVESPLAFARLVRANLMHCRPLDRLLEAEEPPLHRANPLCLDLQCA